MENEKILKKAIDKAVNNGMTAREGMYNKKMLNMVSMGYEDSAYWIIFSHEFAKAFFGSNVLPKFQFAPDFENETKFVIAWQFHLQQMVLFKNPLKYLKRFL